MDAPLALYRRYRPETFSEVIGQEHVTAPLQAALAGNRVNHAYLFSGPRGCGKTTSARILARTLNCKKAPTAEPCGVCDSCRDMARGGPGSIDVIEIDAASHGGVDDARDLREKAFFAPVRSQYKVYIIDEAHMVSTQGFNALLKLVEEPPEHLRFIFATTEPEKVIPTIRSRTHHYPFRLIPPRLLSSYLSELCEREGVTIEPAALPLVVRAGAGSARDSLSVLDQLLGGSGADGVTYQLAAGLLGYTPDTLLDEVVDAFAAGDGAAVFGVVDKVMETGQDPRRFTEDLLRRLRDLVIVAAVPDAPASGLIDVSEDAGERLVAQAARFGAAELTRAADLVATGLTEMRGATAPRLLLELICARVLLPGADHSVEGIQARLDRLERRMDISGTPSVAASGAPTRPAPPVQDRPVHTPAVGSLPEPVGTFPSEPGPAEPPHPVEREPEPVPAVPSVPSVPSATDDESGDAAGQPADDAPAETEQPPAAPAAGRPGGSTLTLVDVRRVWPDVIEATKTRRRVAWMHLTQNSQVIAVEGGVLTLGFTNAGARESFTASGCDEVVRQAAIDVVGADWRIEAIVDAGARPGDDPIITRPAVPEPAAAAATPAPAEVTEPPAWAAPQEPAAQETAPLNAPAAAAPQTPSQLADAAVDRDDADDDGEGLDADELLKATLGAQMIEEIHHT